MLKLMLIIELINYLNLDKNLNNVSTLKLLERRNILLEKDLKLRKEMGERVRKIRNELNLTKDALGKKIGVTGQFLGVVEKGNSAMSYDKLKRLCDISGYSADYILFGKLPNSLNETKELLNEFSEDQIQAVCEVIKKMSTIINKDVD